MKKNQIRRTVLFMASILMMATFIGCKTSEASKEEKQQTRRDKYDDTITITTVIKDMSPDDLVSKEYINKVSEQVSKKLEKEVIIELLPLSEGTYSESMGLLLQSGEIPDLMYFQGGDYPFAITQEILEDLTPYIENSTNVKAMMQIHNEERIKNYPYLLWLSPDRIKVPLIRQDWFDEMESKQQLLNDATPENYKMFFRELKEKKGLKSAYTVPGDITELDTVFNYAFGIDKTWLMQDGSYVYHKVSNAEKEKLVYYAELYEDGLLDQEWLSKKWDTKESAFYNGEVSVVAATSGSVVNVYNQKMINQNGDNAILEVLPPAKGVAQGYSPSDISKESRGWAISALSEHKDEAFSILEYMAGEEGQILDKLGYEGEHHTLEDGIYTLTDKMQEWYPRMHESLVTLDVEFSKETPYFSEPAIQSLEKAKKYSTLDNMFIIPEEYITNWDALEALYAEYVSDVVSGKKSIETFDEFVEQWNTLGGEEITKYANENLSN